MEASVSDALAAVEVEDAKLWHGLEARRHRSVGDLVARTELENLEAGEVGYVHEPVVAD